MTDTLKYLRSNLGIVMFLSNLILLVALFFLYDPFGIIKKSYQDASPIIRLSESDIKEIEIQDADNPETKIVLTRTETKITQPKQNKREPGAPPETKKEELSLNYAWNFQATDSAAKSENKVHTADQERLIGFLKDVKDSRRYYSIDIADEKDGAAGAKKGSEEKDQTRIKFKLKDGSEQILHVGRSSGGNSHLRLNDESEIFLVRNNLKISIGSGDPHYFRNRKIVPPEINADNVNVIGATFPSAKKTEKNSVRISKTGKEWQLLEPVESAANLSAVESLLNDILELKASSFPENLPKDADTKKAFQIEITYNKSLTEPKSFRLEVLAKKGHSTYYIRDETQTIYEISSVFLDDFYDAKKRFAARDEKSPAGNIFQMEEE